MAEPPTMSKTDVLATLTGIAERLRDNRWWEEGYAIDAIADTVRAACWVEGGHLYVGSTWDNRRIELGYCNTCGQRRADGTGGG